MQWIIRTISLSQKVKVPFPARGHVCQSERKLKHDHYLQN